MLQVGLGSWGRRWAELVRDTPDYGIAAVADPDPVSRAWAADTLGMSGEMIFARLDEALDGVDVDAALVTTPPDTHRGVVEAALRSGLPVLVEKPVATTLEDAQAMAATAARNDKTLMVSQNYRYTGMARTMRAAVMSGQVGALLGVRLAFRRDTRAQFPAGDFRYRMRHPLVLDMAIHHFDLLRAITGLEPVAVDARSWRVPDSPYTHDPACAALITMAGDVPVIYDGDWASQGSDTSWNGDWEVTGSAGRLCWRGDSISLERWDEDTVSLDAGRGPADGRVGVLEAFAHAIKTGTAAETDVRDNLRSLALTLGCVASIERGVPVQRDQLLGH